MGERATRVVVVGHVDHGKSTLIGRLLLDLDLLHESKIDDVIASSARRGVAPEWSYVLDSLQEERDQAITIDTSRIWFEHAGRRFVIIDAPGHRQFLANMLTGASEADSAVLVVDATVGVADQTLRHAFLLRFLGIANVIVAINKIDALDDVRARCDEVRAAIIAALDPIVPVAVVPISASRGDNVAHRSSATPWYEGPTIADAIAAAKRFDEEREGRPLRMPVQDVYRDGKRRVIVGSLASGSVEVGQRCTLLPANVVLTVAELIRWPEGSVAGATSGETVGLVFDNDRFAVRGDVLVAADHRPSISARLSLEAFWLDGTAPIVGERLRLRRGMQDVKLVVDSVPSVYDIEAAADAGIAANAQYNIVRFDARAASEVVFDSRARDASGSRCVIMRGNATVGIGFVDSSRVAHRERARVTLGDRERRAAHRAAIFWLTGLSGSGKSTLARRAESALFERGRMVAVLDGDALRNGLNADVGFSAADRREAMRRALAVANILAESGAIVIVALISPFADDRATARDDARHPFFDVFVDASLETCEARDPKRLYQRARGGEITEFTGIDSPYERPRAPDLEIATDRLSERKATARFVDFIENHTRLSE